jgi:D-amino-acid oxidase
VGQQCYVRVKLKHLVAVQPKPAYIIPRPGGTHVILGGTYTPHNHSSLPDLDEAQRILQDCYKLDPLLAGPNGKSWGDIKVVNHGVGLRPAREGGARVELERRAIGECGGDRGSLIPDIRGKGREVGVVHAYGLGAAG